MRRFLAQFPSAEAWGRFLMGTPRRVILTLTALLLAVSALIPGVGTFLGCNLLGLLAPIWRFVQSLLVLGVIVFGFLLMFGWRPRWARRPTGGARH